MACRLAGDRLALPPERLPAAARRAVVQSLLKAGCSRRLRPTTTSRAWRTTGSGERFALRITDAGLHAIGAEAAETATQRGRSRPDKASAAPPTPESPAAEDAPAGPQRADTRLTLRAAA